MEANIYLSGGGTKCAYQTFFLEKISSSNIKINEITGISFGAIVGYFTYLGMHDEMKYYYKNIMPKSLKPIWHLYGFEKYITQIPIFGIFFKKMSNLIWMIYAIKNKGLFYDPYGKKYLESIIIKAKDKPKTNIKFKLIIYNVTKNSKEFKCGEHPLIIEYLTIGCARWLIFSPKNIRQLKTECICNYMCDCNKTESIFCECSKFEHQYNEYIDIGFETPIPYEQKLFKNNKNIDKKNTINIIMTTHDVTTKMNFTTGSNLLEYLDNLISLCSHNTSNIKYKGLCKKIKKNKIPTFIINYDNNNTSIDFDIIDKSKKIGEDKYIKFIDKIRHHLQHPLIHQDHSTLLLV